MAGMKWRHSFVPCGIRSLLLSGLSLPLLCAAQTAYQQPPPEVLAILNAPVTPEVSLSPTRDRLLLIDHERYPSITELARPMFGLAGLRIDPQNSGPYHWPQNTGITIRTLPEGDSKRVVLPQGARFSFPVWAPDGKRFAFALYGASRIDLWLVEASSGQARKIDGVTLNATEGAPLPMDGRRAHPVVPHGPFGPRSGAGRFIRYRAQHPGEFRQIRPGAHASGLTEKTPSTRRGSSTTAPRN